MELNATRTQVKHRNKGLRGMEAVGATGDDSGAVVDTLDHAVGQAVLHLGPMPVR